MNSGIASSMNVLHPIPPVRCCQGLALAMSVLLNIIPTCVTGQLIQSS